VRGDWWFGGEGVFFYCEAVAGFSTWRSGSAVLLSSIAHMRLTFANPIKATALNGPALFCPFRSSPLIRHAFWLSVGQSPLPETATPLPSHPKRPSHESLITLSPRYRRCPP
jgi:hypothetical protein